MRRRHRLVHRAHDALVGLRAGDRQHAGKAVADLLGLGAHAAGDDDAAVFGDRLANRGQALLLGAVQEAAGIDEDHVSTLVIGRHGIAIGAQFGEDAFAVDQRLGAAEAHKTHFGGREGGSCSHFTHAPIVPAKTTAL